MRETETAVGPEAVVTLQAITKETLRPFLKMEVAEHQKGFVAPNAVSIAQAHYEEYAWFRGIYADETPVGFVMLFDDPDKPLYYLWRLMIAAEHQGKGYGRQAMKLLIEYVKSRPGARELLVSYVPGDGSPAPFYRGLGFAETGEEHGGETVMRLLL